MCTYQFQAVCFTGCGHTVKTCIINTVVCRAAKERGRVCNNPSERISRTSTSSGKCLDCRPDY